MDETISVAWKRIFHNPCYNLPLNIKFGMAGYIGTLSENAVKNTVF
jgi:hypothetical protein